MPISVAIVEDDDDLAEEIAGIISETPGFKIACVCRNIRSAINRIPPAAPDVVIMDLRLPDGSGIDATACIKRRAPRTEVLVFTVNENTAEIVGALEAGASGYLLKDISAGELLAALRKLKGGEVPMSALIARKVLATFRRARLPPPAVDIHDGPRTLTPREVHILHLLTKGRTSKEIANTCAITIETVNSHLKRIYGKLRVHTRTEAAVKFLEMS